MEPFDNNVTKAQVRQAEAALAKAQENAQYVNEGIQLEVHQAYLNLLSAEKYSNNKCSSKSSK